MNTTRRSRNTIAAVILSILFGAALLSGSLMASSADGPIRIGVILPLSGDMASNGAAVYDAYAIAAEVTNEMGGVNGRTIELIRADSPDPSTAQQNARRLAGRGVNIFMGSLANHLGLAASSVVNRGGIYFETTAVSEEFTARGLKNVFRASTPGAQMGTTAIDFGKEVLGVSRQGGTANIRVAIVFEPNWQLIAEAARARAGEHGMEVVLYTDYDSRSLDLSPLVAQLRRADPDLVLAGGWLNDSVLLNRQSKQVGFRPKAWIGLSGGHSIKDYANNLDKLADGIFVVNASSTVADSGLTENGRALKATFVERWNRMHPGQMPTGLVYEAFGNAWVLMNEALPHAGRLSTEEIREAILAIDLPQGALPNGTGAKFTGDGANERSFYTVLQWQDGSLVTVWPDSLATNKILQ